LRRTSSVHIFLVFVLSFFLIVFFKAKLTPTPLPPPPFLPSLALSLLLSKGFSCNEGGKKEANKGLLHHETRTSRHQPKKTNNKKNSSAWDNKATFKTKEQLLAVHLVLKRERDLLIVSATGSGKDAIGQDLVDYLFPALEQKLREEVSSQVVTIRGDTRRPNIVYQVKVCDSAAGMRDEVSVLLASCRLVGNERAIMFCATQAHCETMAGHLPSCTIYHSGLTTSEKDDNFASWRSGNAIVMIAPPAFGAGVDYGAVRLVVHSGPTYGMLEYAQGTGRAGRDGKGARAVLLLQKNAHLQNRQQEEVRAYGLGTTTCSRQAIHLAVDDGESNEKKEDEEEED